MTLTPDQLAERIIRETDERNAAIAANKAKIEDINRLTEIYQKNPNIATPEKQDWLLSERQKALKALRPTEKMGIGEYFTDKWTPATSLPFVPTEDTRTLVFKILPIVKKMKQGQEPSFEEKIVLQDYYNATDTESERGKTILAQAADVILTMPAYMGEFSVGLGTVATPAKVAAKTIAGKVLRSYAAKGIGKYATKAAGTLAAGAAIAGTSGIGNVAAGAARNYTTTDDSIAKSIYKGFADTWAENTGEMTGAAMRNAFGGLLKAALPKGSRLAAMASKMSDSEISDRAGKFLKNVGYDGTLEEMGEERFSDLMRAVLGVGEFSDVVPSGEQMAVEGLAFAVPGALGAGINKLRGKGGKPSVVDQLASAPGDVVTNEDGSKSVTYNTPEEANRAFDAIVEEAEKAGSTGRVLIDGATITVLPSMDDVQAEQQPAEQPESPVVEQEAAMPTETTAQTETVPDLTKLPAINEIVGNLRTQIENAGRSKQEADAFLTLLVTRSEAEAKRQGIGTEKVLQRYGLLIQKMSPEEFNQVFDNTLAKATQETPAQEAEQTQADAPSAQTVPVSDNKPVQDDIKQDDDLIVDKGIRAAKDLGGQVPQKFVNKADKELQKRGLAPVDKKVNKANKDYFKKLFSGERKPITGDTYTLPNNSKLEVGKVGEQLPDGSYPVTVHIIGKKKGRVFDIYADGSKWTNQETEKQPVTVETADVAQADVAVLEKPEAKLPIIVEIEDIVNSITEKNSISRNVKKLNTALNELEGLTEDDVSTEQKSIKVLDELFEIEKKAGILQDSGTLQEKIDTIKKEIEDKYGLIYTSPNGEDYNETRTDIRAYIAGTSPENLSVVDVIEPIIRKETTKTVNGVNVPVSKIVRPARAVVESKDSKNQPAPVSEAAPVEETSSKAPESKISEPIVSDDGAKVKDKWQAARESSQKYVDIEDSGEQDYKGAFAADYEWQEAIQGILKDVADKSGLELFYERAATGTGYITLTDNEDRDYKIRLSNHDQVYGGTDTSIEINANWEKDLNDFIEKIEADNTASPSNDRQTTVKQEPTVKENLTVENVKPVRFEIGKALSPKDRESVLSSIGDSYKDLGAPKLPKAATQDGETVYGYVYDTNYMYTSDITGKKIRHYVFLPDGRKAHPSELYPDITREDVLSAVKSEGKKKKDIKREFEDRISDTVADANLDYMDRNLNNKDASHNEKTVLLQKDGKFVRVSSNPILEYGLQNGWEVRSRNQQSEWADDIISKYAKLTSEQPSTVEKPKPDADTLEKAQKIADKSGKPVYVAQKNGKYAVRATEPKGVESVRVEPKKKEEVNKPATAVSVVESNPTQNVPADVRDKAQKIADEKGMPVFLVEKDGKWTIKSKPFNLKEYVTISPKFDTKEFPPTDIYVTKRKSSVYSNDEVFYVSIFSGDKQLSRVTVQTLTEAKQIAKDNGLDFNEDNLSYMIGNKYATGSRLAVRASYKDGKYVIGNDNYQRSFDKYSELENYIIDTYYNGLREFSDDLAVIKEGRKNDLPRILNEETVNELHQRAKKEGVEVEFTAKKEDIIKAILNNKTTNISKPVEATKPAEAKKQSEQAPKPEQKADAGGGFTETDLPLPSTKVDKEKQKASFDDLQKGRDYQFKYQDGERILIDKNGKTEKYMILSHYIQDGDARYTVYPPGKKASIGTHIWVHEYDILNKPKQSTVVEQGNSNTKSKIDDFGEKLEGARKDYASKMEKAKDLDIATNPLDKVFPEPDYQGLIDKGVRPYLVNVVRAIRDSIPKKPVGRLKYKMDGYVKDVETLRELANIILRGTFEDANIAIKLRERKLQPVIDAAEMYEIFGHGQSLKGYRLNHAHFSMYKGEKDVWKWLVEKKTDKKYASYSTLVEADTKEEAIEKFREKLDAGLPKKTKGTTQFTVYRYKRANSKYYIGTKIGNKSVDLMEFDTADEAIKYSKDHNAELLEMVKRYKDVPELRKETNAPRKGKEHRGGKDVTPEMFTEAFGFRGVQFGNWVGKTGERQKSLNDAYDALFDLAEMLNLPTQSLSLNGKLGLAFGARGIGGVEPAAAHYEPDKVVINLTRMHGAGSLAHEWWHALDNYLSRVSGTKSGYLTQNYFNLGTEAKLNKKIIDGIKNLMGAIKKTELEKRSENLDSHRSKPYWSKDIEMAARVFENYVRAKMDAKGYSNDYLANVKNKTDFARDMVKAILSTEKITANDMWPYLTDAETKDIVPVLDSLFADISQDSMLFNPNTLYQSAAEAGAKPSLVEKAKAAWLKLGTESPYFKAWFGKSKVVDENGKPLVVYHGTPQAGFESFRELSHFTDNPEYAALYINRSASSTGVKKQETSPAVYSAYLSIQRPFDTRIAANAKLYQEFTSTYGNNTPLSERGLPDWTDAENLLEWIEETGQQFDGLYLDEGGTPEGGFRGISYIPLKPSQIKSVSNQGTFEAENPNILYQSGTSKGDIPKRSTKYGVGKAIGGRTYVHKQYENVFNGIEAAKAKLPKNFTYDIVAYDEATGSFTFSKTDDWNNNPEPAITQQIIVKDGTAKSITQSADPWIYHHKYLFVKDNYTGFDVEESKNRSRDWINLPVDKSRIGKKSYWESNVVPLIGNNILFQSVITDEDIAIANSTSRGGGSVGANALVPRMVRQFINKDTSILDFGAGKVAQHAESLKRDGYKVTAYEFGTNINPKLHDKDALSRQYDVVYASNVINVQNSEAMLESTIDQIYNATKDGGVVILNLPSSPRKGAYAQFATDRQAADYLQGKLSEKFNSIKRIGGTASAPVFIMAKGAIKNNVLLQSNQSGNRGSIEFTDEGAVITVMENADASTLVHELGHLFLRDMIANNHPDVPAIRKWVGNKGGNFTREQEEKFARGWEAYLRRGKAPAPFLQRVFDDFKSWLKKVYKTAKDLDVKLNKDIIGVFDRMLGGVQEAKTEEAPVPQVSESKIEAEANKVPDVEPDAENPNYLSPKHAVVLRELKEYFGDTTGIVPNDGSRAWIEDVKIAFEQNIADRALRIASEMLATGRDLTMPERAGLLIKAIELNKEHKALIKKRNATTDDVEFGSVSIEMDRVLEEYQLILRAMYQANRQSGRAFNFGKLTMAIEDFSLISVLSEAKHKKGDKALTTKERAEIEKVVSELESLKERFTEMEAKYAKELSEALAKHNIRQGGVARYRSMTIEDKNSDLQILITKTQTLLEEGCYNG